MDEKREQDCKLCCFIYQISLSTLHLIHKAGSFISQLQEPVPDFAALEIAIHVSVR